MRARERLADWLDIRESEFRILVLSVLGAFFIMGFAVLANSLRDAFYLGEFDSDTLPYILYASLALGLPAVAVFSRLLASRTPSLVMRGVAVVAGSGLLLIFVVVALPGPVISSRLAAVVFYLWTQVAVLLLTSGFWIVLSDAFAVREAKRLFGLISAGGAMGTVVIGVSLSLLLEDLLRPIHLVPALVALLLLAQLTLELMPRDRLGRARRSGGQERQGALQSLRTLVSNRHLRLIAGIVLLTSAASYVVSWQLLDALQANATAEAARAGLVGEEAIPLVNTRIASFMGAFRGWTGGLAFVIQVFVAGRLLAGAGVAWSLALLPLALLFGSVGMLVFPGLLAATLVRGADNTLGKSLYRTVAELLWVPVPPALRRRAKAFVDSMVSNAGDGLGALIVLLWVSLLRFPSHLLSVFVIVMSLALLALSRAMGMQYFVTLRTRLEQSGNQADVLEAAGLERADRLGATLTRLDITRVLGTTGLQFPMPDRPAREPDDASAAAPAPTTPSEMLRSGDPARIERALRETDAWTEDDVPLLIPLLARDAWLGAAVRALAEHGKGAVPHLRSVLLDDSSDFVIRRRIPGVLARIDHADADRALIEALGAGRFEVRYRAALSLNRRRRRGMAVARDKWQEEVWDAIRLQVNREKAVWELARLLDPEADDGFVERRVGLRGELSLEHTFRLLSLVLDRDTIRAAYHGIVLNDPELRSFALEYLEQVLPADVRDRLWPFIGDLSASAEQRALRNLDDVVADLLQTGATLFGSQEDREALRRYLDESEGGSS
jgi:AAA family ATP:ADP antiporter